MEKRVVKLPSANWLWLFLGVLFVLARLDLTNARPAKFRRECRFAATGLAPDPATTPQAVIQVYAARATQWRGYFGVHTWIAVKPTAGGEEGLEANVLGATAGIDPLQLSLKFPLAGRIGWPVGVGNTPTPRACAIDAHR